MTILILLGTAGLLGWFMQAKKGRTGAAWGILSLVVLVVWWCIYYAAMASASPEMLKDGTLALDLAVALTGGGVLFLIFWSLPKKEKALR